MRVCIIGLDGLEYEFVMKFDLKHLKQVEYGRVKINVGFLSTPTIWASFITGLMPSEHGVIGLRWGNRLLNAVKNFVVKVGLAGLLDKSAFIQDKLHKMFAGQEMSFPIIKGKVPTIFDYASNPIHISVPCYSEQDMPVYEELRREVAQALGNPLAEKRVLEKSRKVFEDKRRKCLRELEKDWDLFMVHFLYPDVFQHLRWYREDEVRGLYEELDETTRMFKERVDEEDTLVLVVSDHGHKRGLHTPHGFYSSNKRLGLHEPKITDFADIIKQELGVPSEEEIEQVKRRLEEWGYF